MGMFEGTVAPAIVYGCEACAEDKNVWKRLNVLEMKCLDICDVKKVVQEVKTGQEREAWY